MLWSWVPALLINQHIHSAEVWFDGDGGKYQLQEGAAANHLATAAAHLLPEQ
jgi:hypothetical protein